MKKIILPALIAAFIFMAPMVCAEPSLSFDLTPESSYNQVWAYETYLVNVTLGDFNISNVDLTGYSGDPTGFYLIGNIYWKGHGGYDFGEATTGYSYNLDSLQLVLNMPLNKQSVSFNLTLEDDALDLGMKPYESVEITIKFDVYLLMDDDSTGPKIITSSHTYSLVDETKVDYLGGKFSDMQEEINAVLDSSGLKSFNRERFQGILEAMNTSLTQGDYVEALDIWSDYDEDDRIDLINGIINSANKEYTELEELRSVEAQLTTAQQSLEMLQEEYDLLENTYVALANTYSKVNTELNVAKRNLATAITAVFLTAIVFYFLGRRGVKKEVEEVA